jgi:hypothetical protein
MTKFTAVRLSPDVVFRELDGEAVLLDFNTGRYFGLNAVGTRVWTLIAGGTSVRDAVRALAAEFDAPADEIARDVDALVADLVARGLLVADGEPRAGS